MPTMAHKQCETVVEVSGSITMRIVCLSVKGDPRPVGGDDFVNPYPGGKYEKRRLIAEVDKQKLIGMIETGNDFGKMEFDHSISGYFPQLQQSATGRKKHRDLYLMDVQSPWEPLSLMYSNAGY
jgi:hypothetical protein